MHLTFRKKITVNDQAYWQISRFYKLDTPIDVRVGIYCQLTRDRKYVPTSLPYYLNQANFSFSIDSRHSSRQNMAICYQEWERWLLRLDLSRRWGLCVYLVLVKRNLRLSPGYFSLLNTTQNIICSPAVVTETMLGIALGQGSAFKLHVCTVRHAHKL